MSATAAASGGGGGARASQGDEVPRSPSEVQDPRSVPLGQLSSLACSAAKLLTAKTSIEPTDAVYYRCSGDGKLTMYYIEYQPNAKDLGDIYRYFVSITPLIDFIVKRPVHGLKSASNPAVVTSYYDALKKLPRDSLAPVMKFPAGSQSVTVADVIGGTAATNGKVLPSACNQRVIRLWASAGVPLEAWGDWTMNRNTAGDFVKWMEFQAMLGTLPPPPPDVVEAATKRCTKEKVDIIHGGANFVVPEAQRQSVGAGTGIDHGLVCVYWVVLHLKMETHQIKQHVVKGNQPLRYKQEVMSAVFKVYLESLGK